VRFIVLLLKAALMLVQLLDWNRLIWRNSTRLSVTIYGVRDLRNRLRVPCVCKEQLTFGYCPRVEIPDQLRQWRDPRLPIGSLDMDRQVTELPKKRGTKGIQNYALPERWKALDKVIQHAEKLRASA